MPRYAKAVFTRLMKAVRDPYVVWEQPKGSWMYKLPVVVSLFTAYRLTRVVTYMAFFDA